MIKSPNYEQHSIIGNSGTLRDFFLRKNHLTGYPSLLSQEHNIRLAVRLLADAHPNPTSSDFAKLNIIINLSFGSGGKRNEVYINGK
jgi:hypothetical protein